MLGFARFTVVPRRIVRRKFFGRDLIWISAQPNLRAAKGLGDPTPTKYRACVFLKGSGKGSVGFRSIHGGSA